VYDAELDSLSNGELQRRCPYCRHVHSGTNRHTGGTELPNAQWEEKKATFCLEVNAQRNVIQMANMGYLPGPSNSTDRGIAITNGANNVFAAPFPVDGEEQLRTGNVRSIPPVTGAQAGRGFERGWNPASHQQQQQTANMPSQARPRACVATSYRSSPAATAARGDTGRGRGGHGGDRARMIPGGTQHGRNLPGAGQMSRGGEIRWVGGPGRQGQMNRGLGGGGGGGGYPLGRGGQQPLRGQFIGRQMSSGGRYGHQQQPPQAQYLVRQPNRADIGCGFGTRRAPYYTAPEQSTSSQNVAGRTPPVFYPPPQGPRTSGYRGNPYR
jgi:hypothetical protein